MSIRYLDYEFRLCCELLDYFERELPKKHRKKLKKKVQLYKERHELCWLYPYMPFWWRRNFYLYQIKIKGTAGDDVMSTLYKNFFELAPSWLLC